MQTTLPKNVVLPSTTVTLKHLKDASGCPVVVGVRQVSEVTLARITGSLPGEKDAPADGPGLAEVDPANALAQATQAMSIAPEVIELGTFFTCEDGSEIVPAFTFAKDRREFPESLPGWSLRDEDRMILMEAILKIGGYLGVAEETSFSVDATGGGCGVGTMAPGPVNGADAVGSGS